MTVKTALKKILQSTGKTAYRLAQETGISRQVLSHWARNGATAISLRHLVALRRASGMSWRELGELLEREADND